MKTSLADLRRSAYVGGTAIFCSEALAVGSAVAAACRTERAVGPRAGRRLIVGKYLKRSENLKTFEV